MDPSTPRRLVLVAVVGTLVGCANPRAVLVNDKGEYLTCASTSVGIVSGIVGQARYDSCVTEGQARGYRIEREEK